jgi:YbbR domain-containing protein
MRTRSAHWLIQNIGALALALLLAIVVWVSAVIIADPNERRNFRPVNIEIVGQAPDLLLQGQPPSQVRLTLVAPRSIWDQLNANPALVKAWIDLAGLEAGEHTVPVKVSVDASPVRLIQIDPQQISLILEPLVRRDYAVQLMVKGALPLGYHKDDPTLTPGQVTISGLQSAMQSITQVSAELDIDGATTTFTRTLPVQVLDENGLEVSGITIIPKEVTVSQPINLLGGFKNVAIKVVTRGQVANGFRLTNITVSPPTATLFSDDPKVIQQIPGYVETMPVDLSNLRDDLEMSVDLNLPPGVTLVSKAGVLVQVSVAAIEGSLTLSVPVEIVGLTPELTAVVSPKVVDVIVAGPLNVLDTLTPKSFRVIVDLTGLPAGVYQRTAVVDFAPDQVRVQTTLPETVEVKIDLLPTLTPVITGTLTITPAQTPSVTP